MQFYAKLDRLLEPIRNRIRMLFAKSLMTLIDDSTGIQLIQVSYATDGDKDKVQRLQPYGLTSHPLKDAQVFLAFLNGNRDHGVALNVGDSRYRVKPLPEGGVCLYDYDGNMVKLTKDDGILVDAPNQKVVVHAGGDIEIGNASLKKLVNEEFADIFNNHTHNYTTPLHPSAVGPSLAPNTSLGAGQMTSKVTAE